MELYRRMVKMFKRFWLMDRSSLVMTRPLLCGIFHRILSARYRFLTSKAINLSSQDLMMATRSRLLISLPKQVKATDSLERFMVAMEPMKDIGLAETSTISMEPSIYH